MTLIAPAAPRQKPTLVAKPVLRASVRGKAKPGRASSNRAAVHAVRPAPLKRAAGRYVEAVGRRKTAIVRVRLYGDSEAGVKQGIIVNEREFAAYFPVERHRHLAAAPLVGASLSPAEVRVTAHAKGGGVQAQAEALSLGLARALIKREQSWRPRLKALGLLTRDPRMVESKKFGSRKARRPQQWRKR